ncbi:hypothetical protein E8E13_011566 [Curvularia kusanoi]|uniref:Uncharacterized protein n=1 Tax=Curvularia kusanoi TaxID=90978 RepID=A0A9P4WD66_CURKU|nr:hypothetical protein E8E13_011566 [Curvularia kusanoi]
MLLALLLLAGAASAKRFCIASRSPPNLPPCTDQCLAGDMDVVDGVCADNLKGICELDGGYKGGVWQFFENYSRCLDLLCTMEPDRKMMFQKACGWDQNISDENASYFGEWQSYLQRPSAAEATVTMTGGGTDYSTAVSSATTNGGDGPDDYSSAVSTELPLSTTAPQTTTGFSQPPTKTTRYTVYVSTTYVSATTKSTVVGYGTPANSQTSSTALSYSSGSSAPANHEKSMSPAVIAGIAVASIAILGSFVVAAFFLSRRFQRRHHGRSAETPPPLVHEPDKGRHPHEKAELDAKHSEVGFGAPVGHAELDGGSPVNPIYEPVHVRASERRARIAQNF